LENAIETELDSQGRRLLPGPDVRYVDRDHPVNVRLRDGSVLRPFNTVIRGGINAVPAGGIVSIVTGLYNEILTINKAMTLTAPVGTVRIGSLPESFAQHGADILIQQQGNLGH
jgi:hypothetical protein